MVPLPKKKFSLGSLIEKHEVGPYGIWEYHPHKRDGVIVTKEIDFETTHYHGLIDGKEVGVSWDSLDKALAGLIVMRSLGPNCHAIDTHFIAGIEAMAKNG